MRYYGDILSYLRYLLTGLMVLPMGFLVLPAGQRAQATHAMRRQAGVRVVAAADSMDAAHLLYSDTSALRSAIRTFDTPVGRHIHRNALAAAYYYMGRNMSQYDDYAQAADCYIACDRLQPDDPVRRGRVNACMAYICTQQSEDSLALIFNQRSTEAFRESGDTARYLYGLLFLSENYCKLGEYPIADSLWQEARAFHLDSAYQFYVLETRGLYFYYRQQYDSALTCFLQLEEYPRGNQSKCYDYMKIAQIYESIGKPALAYPYAEYLVKHSTNPAQISNAYYTLINYAEQTGDAALLATYSHNREDAGREKLALSSRYGAAVEKCRQYIANPHPDRKWYIIVWIATVLCGILCAVIGLLRHRKHKAIKQRDIQIRQLHIQTEAQSALLQAQTDLIEKQALQLQQLREELRAKAMQDMKGQLSHLRSLFPQPRKEWVCFAVLLKDTNPTFLHLHNALKEQNLKEPEIKLCIYYLLYHETMPLTEIAGYVCKSATGIRTIKSRIAHKLGVTSAGLLGLLQKMAI